MNKEFKVLIDSHFEDGALSKQAPKIKDFVLIRKEGEKRRIKKYLLITLEKPCELFKENTVSSCGQCEIFKIQKIATNPHSCKGKFPRMCVYAGILKM